MSQRVNIHHARVKRVLVGGIKNSIGTVLRAAVDGEGGVGLKAPEPIHSPYSHTPRPQNRHTPPTHTPGREGGETSLGPAAASPYHVTRRHLVGKQAGRAPSLPPPLIKFPPRRGRYSPCHDVVPAPPARRPQSGRRLRGPSKECPVPPSGPPGPVGPLGRSPSPALGATQQPRRHAGAQVASLGLVPGEAGDEFPSPGQEMKTRPCAVGGGSLLVCEGAGSHGSASHMEGEDAPAWSRGEEGKFLQTKIPTTSTPPPPPRPGDAGPPPPPRALWRGARGGGGGPASPGRGGGGGVEVVGILVCKNFPSSPLDHAGASSPSMWLAEPWDPALGAET
ncbi:collagen, type I, alpha 1b-like [Bacillus rossius redtenbacheri]|uniref:collagen, type I, alpha 1b-like n=1 Tax=Bacillus rossius redtenbacheri TaxID=93214 RepID=UPI002FDCD308